MEFEQNVLELLQAYMNYLEQPKNCLDMFVDYWIPIMSAIILILTSLAAVIKYYKEKNKDYYEKILNEVYAPLYQYIIKQEYVRHLKPDEMPVDKHPIISLVDTKTTIKNMFTENQITEVEKKDIIKNTDLLNVKGTLNFGLVPQDLLILLNSYEMANILHNSVSDNEFHAIETKLRMTIIEGYEEYKKKLGLKNSSKLLKRKNNELTFSFTKE